jgi:TetR/AcrR family transcriptional regulator
MRSVATDTREDDVAAAVPAIATERRTRDAERSREAILDAAERQFADRGFDAVSLQEIATAAGLSRGAPSYFFGSKDSLYEAVLERVFADRDAATRLAFEPVTAWAAGAGSRAALRRALQRAIAGYLQFLIARPSFVRLLDWEAIGDGGRLHPADGGNDGRPRARGHAMADAFGAVRAVARGRGLATFDVDDAVLVTVALTFSLVSQRATLMQAIGRDLSDATTVRRHTGLVVDQLLHLIAP